MVFYWFWLIVKKIVALFSILHMTLFILIFIALILFSVLSGIITSISHGYCSIGKFWVVGLLISKVYINCIDIFILISKYILVLLISLLICNLSFPVSFNFVGEIISYICIIEIDCFFCLLVLIVNLFLSSFYWFLVLNRNLPFYLCYCMFNLFEYVICF
jgi:NADH:ubiquinone oxidoreductase subunit 4 (subunit M)